MSSLQLQWLTVDQKKKKKVTMKEGKEKPITVTQKMITDQQCRLIHTTLPKGRFHVYGSMPSPIVSQQGKLPPVSQKRWKVIQDMIFKVTGSMR